MAALTLALASVSSVAAADPPRPNFPTSWTAQEASDLVINQGGTNGPNGVICCDPKAPQCKIQTESQVGTHYWDGKGNQTRFDGNGQIIVTKYTIGKQMLVSSNGTCLEFCPTEGGFDPSPFWPDAGDKERIKDLGKATVDGVETHHFQWIQHILGVVKMQQTDMYVKLPSDPTGEATPVWEHDIIEPFGQQLGVQDTHWSSFTPGQPAASLFEVTGVSTCQESPNCGNSLRQACRLRDGDLLAFAKYH